MAMWILKANGEVVPRRSHRPLKIDELYSEEEDKKQALFDKLVEKKFGTSINKPMVTSGENKDLEEYESMEEQPRLVPDIEDSVDNKGMALNQSPAYDRLLNSEVLLQLEDQGHATGIVKRRVTNESGNLSGRYDDNLYLNSLVYEVEFSDSYIREYSANVIAENILTQVDPEGFSKTMIKAIVDFKKDNAVAVSKSDGYLVT